MMQAFREQPIAELRERLETWRRPSGTTGATPRVDGFAAMLSIAGAAKALVDVNDASPDGNRRVVKGPPDPNSPGGNVLQLDLYSSNQIDPTTVEHYRTEPDGVINMRDFRRFRDARTLTCLEAGSEERSAFRMTSCWNSSVKTTTGWSH